MVCGEYLGLELLELPFPLRQAVADTPQVAPTRRGGVDCHASSSWRAPGGRGAAWDGSGPREWRLSPTASTAQDTPERLCTEADFATLRACRAPETAPCRFMEAVHSALAHMCRARVSRALPAAVRASRVASHTCPQTSAEWPARAAQRRAPLPRERGTRPPRCTASHRAGRKGANPQGGGVGQPPWKKVWSATQAPPKGTSQDARPFEVLTRLFLLLERALGFRGGSCG